MKPGTIVKPTVVYAQFMERHGCRAPYDGVVLSTSQDFVRVVWNNADGHAMQMHPSAVEPTGQRVCGEEVEYLVDKANSK